jgi:ribonucleoside-diphosphate reductase beta chain
MDAKVEFVTTYHMVIEGTLALTGQHFMLDYYENNELLPGFAEGFANIARDEHRHVAYGTWFLQQKCAEERYRVRVQETLNELLPLAAGVLVPKGFTIGDGLRVLRLHLAGAGRVRVQRAHAAAEGDRPLAAYCIGCMSQSMRRRA